MASVVLGRVGSDVVVPTDLCVKSGIATDQRVILRGSTTPGWVHVLLLFTIIGWLFASSMASHRFRAEVPFLHHRHELYRRGYLIASGLSVFGVVASVLAAVVGWSYPASYLLFTVAGLVFGGLNSWLTMVGFHEREGFLLMTRVHPAAAAAIRATYAAGWVVR
jgi:hypothetical protein